MDGIEATALGHAAVAASNNSTAIGTQAVAQGDSTTALAYLRLLSTHLPLDTMPLQTRMMLLSLEQMELPWTWMAILSPVLMLL